MKPKAKFALRLRNPEDPPQTTSTPPQTTSKPTQKRHNSLHQEKENRKRMDAKKKEIAEAVDYCRKNIALIVIFLHGRAKWGKNSNIP